MKKQFETITKEEVVIEQVEKLDKKGIPVLDEQGEVIKEEKEVVKTKQYIVETIPEKKVEHDKDVYISMLQEKIDYFQGQIDFYQSKLNSIE